LRTPARQRRPFRHFALGRATAAASASLAGAAAAQATAGQPANASIAVLMPIALTKTTDLSFGTVVRPTSGNGNVSVDASTGTRTLSGNVTALGGGSVSRAAFTVGGEGGQNFTVTVPSTFNMVRVGGSDSMQVSLTSTMGGGMLSGSFGSAGSASFGVGGQVGLSNTTPSGSYTGTFTVTVAYN
jgi:spore coat protein U-like protein